MVSPFSYLFILSLFYLLSHKISDWAKEWYRDEVDEGDYMIFINITAYNKRKTSIQTTSKQIIDNAEEGTTQSTSPGNSRERRRQRQNQSDPLAEKILATSVGRLSTPASQQCSPEFVKKTSQQSIRNRQQHRLRKFLKSSLRKI